MKIAFFITSLFALYRTIIYGIFEIKRNDNRTGGTIVIVTGIIGIAISNIMIYLRS